jgi:osmotically-inducible protein OsmY
MESIEASVSNRSRSWARAAGAVALLLAIVLGGCATYRKCGLHGCPGDAELTSAVQANFSGHASIMPPNLINVRALDGVVYLSGLVDTDLQRQLAESVARATPGVKRVVNSIGLNNNSGF